MDTVAPLNLSDVIARNVVGDRPLDIEPNRSTVLSMTFHPAHAAGTITFPNYASALDYVQNRYGAIIHGTSVNDGKREYGKIYS